MVDYNISIDCFEDVINGYKWFKVRQSFKILFK